MAPDRASLQAASKMLKPTAWPLLARDPAGTVVWGEAQGSGSAPYRLAFDQADEWHKCSCPSRKFPCKHVLAMMWQFALHPDRFAPADPAPWVTEWLSRRRGSSAAAPMRGPRDTTSIAALPLPEPEDPADGLRSAQARARTEAARQASVSAGLEALDVWIDDQLRAGLAGFVQRSQTACRTMARRLVDAKAGGLAARLDALHATLLGLPDALRADRLMIELGTLHLIAAAWQRRAALSGTLQTDLRRVIGWTARREDLLADGQSVRQAGVWVVAGTRTVIQPDRLRRTETWLCPAEADPRLAPAALLLDFTPVQIKPSGEALQPGERFPAELVFYPSPVPLRAVIAGRGATKAFAAAPAGGPDPAEAFAAWQRRVAAVPWLGDDLIRAGHARIIESDGATWLAGTDGGAGFRLAPAQARQVLPLTGLDLSAATGVWDGQLLTLLSAETSLGPWFAP